MNKKSKKINRIDKKMKKNVPRLMAVLEHILFDKEFVKTLFTGIKNKNNLGAYMVDCEKNKSIAVRFYELDFFKPDVPIENEIINDVNKCTEKEFIFVGYIKNTMVVRKVLFSGDI